MEQKKNNNEQSEKQQNSEKRAFNKMSLLAEAMRETFLYIHFSLFGVTNTTKLIRQNEMYRFGKTKCDYFV